MTSRDPEISRRLLRWYREQRRVLPWRGTKDPYAIWLSEVMLQQTTVAAVLPRYERFLRRFPDVASLARARRESVLAEWSGLGYYGRARNLHEAARRIVREHRGKVPSDPGTLAELPGVGAYIAAAVASLGYGARVPAAEANVTRVLARVFAIPGASGDARLRRRVLEAAAGLLPRTRPGDLLVALMDLGQLVCLPRVPRCPACPLESRCEARRRAGGPARFPARVERAKPVIVHVAAAAIAASGRVLLRRRRASSLSGLWEFPSAEASTAEAARRELAASLLPLAVRLEPASAAARARHTIMRRRLSISVFEATAPAAAAFAPPESYRWFTSSELDRAAVPTLTRKIAAACGFLPPRNRRILFSSAPPPNSDFRRDGSGRAGRPHAPDVEEWNSLRVERAAADRRRTNRVHDLGREGVLPGGDRGGVDRKRSAAHRGAAPVQPSGLARARRDRAPAARAAREDGRGRGRDADPARRVAQARPPAADSNSRRRVDRDESALILLDS